MLTYLRIRGLGLIEDVELEFGSGLVALTGETGAGKSFIVRALEFLAGAKMGPEAVRPGADEAVVEALFELDNGGGPEETALRRVLSAETGRSRVFMDGSLASLNQIAELKPRLFLHTSQHAQQKLLQPAHQVALVDAFLDDPSLLEERAERLEAARAARQALEECRDKAARLAERRDLLEHQAAQIDKVDPQPGEEGELLAKREELRTQSRAAEDVEAALGVLHGQGGLLEGLDGLSRRLGNLAEALAPEDGEDDQLGEDAAFWEEARHRARDLDANLRNLAPASAEAEAERVEERLYAIARLKRTLGRDFEGLLALAEEAREALSFLDASALDEKRLAREADEAVEALRDTLARLGQARREAAARLGERLSAELAELGFSSDVEVRAEFEEREVLSGEPPVMEERPRLLFRPNPGQPAQPLDRIASGGELSRFLLAVSGMRGEADDSTLIFDEVDAGVGGMTLEAVASRLAALGRERQVLCISHWPQIAARAGDHFQVVKEVADGATYTRCHRLGPAEREEELARMAGGGERGLAMARGLLSETG
ncbi:DNA repair protein RecN [Desulfohalovibrio reitneri]|uniref:DNA repair protein RecN n=1 Tax=Desulfohalovibrio reitneri TaxID=1307759 RepID=UPI0004A7872C|nr:AAA family ATPase [Desulfohalovibrio reitneri]